MLLYATQSNFLFSKNQVNDLTTKCHILFVERFIFSNPSFKLYSHELACYYSLALSPLLVNCVMGLFYVSLLLRKMATTEIRSAVLWSRKQGLTPPPPMLRHSP